MQKAKIIESTKNNTNTKYSTMDTKYHLYRNLFEFLFVIGKGGFGKVWRVRYRRTQEIFALKEMSKRKILDKKSEYSINNERVFLSKLRHPFLVNMHYAFQDTDNLYLVIDILNGGDLRFHCSRYRKFSEEQTRFFVACMVHALSYVHANNVIHRDVKPENLILDDKGYVHLTDFGIAKENKGDNSSETSGTPGYMSPEVILGIGHSFSVDYYAIGVIGFEFMTGKRPYIGKTRREIKEQMFKKQARLTKKKMEKEWSLDSMDFINRLIERKPELRLGSKNGIQELKDHFWLRYYPWKELEKKTLPGPFIPEKRKNFDKRYCESIEQIGETTMLRYDQIALRDDYITAFANFYYNRDEKDKEKEIQTNTNSNMNINANINSNNNEIINIEDSSIKKKKKSKICKISENSENNEGNKENIKDNKDSKEYKENKENKENKIIKENKTKPKTLFCLLKCSYDNKDKNEKSTRGNKIKINYQNNKERRIDNNKIPKNVYNHLMKERMNKYNSFSSFLLLKNNMFNKISNNIMERMKDNDSLEKKNSKCFQTFKEESSNNNYQYSSNSHRMNLIHSPSNYSLFNNIKNKIFHYQEKAYQKSVKKTEKNKNSFSHYKKLNSFILNNNNLNNSLSTIRLSNMKNNNNNERTYKIYNIKGNNTSRMELNKKFNIKFTFNKTKNVKEDNIINIRKRLYRNNSAEYIGAKELNKAILKKLQPSYSKRNIK